MCASSMSSRAFICLEKVFEIPTLAVSVPVPPETYSIAMEAAGLVVGVISLASLWEACMQVFDVVVTVQHYDWDCKLARVKLETEHVRLSAWGKAVGFVDLGRGWHSGTPQHSVGSPSRHAFPQHPRLRDPQVANIVWDNLGCMRHLFDKIRTLQRRHAMHHVGSSHSSDFSDGPLTTSCTPLPHRQSGRPRDSPNADTSKASITKRIRWAISDRHRFKELIAEIRWLNDSLCSLVPDVVIGARDNLQQLYFEEVDDIEPLIGTSREDSGEKQQGRTTERASEPGTIHSLGIFGRIVGDEAHWPYSPIGEDNKKLCILRRILHAIRNRLRAMQNARATCWKARKERNQPPLDSDPTLERDAHVVDEKRTPERARGRTHTSPSRPEVKSHETQVKVQYPFESDGEGDLPLLAGTKVDVLDGRDPAWWLVREPCSGQEGVIPAAYLL